MSLINPTLKFVILQNIMITNIKHIKVCLNYYIYFLKNKNLQMFFLFIIIVSPEKPTKSFNKSKYTSISNILPRSSVSLPQNPYS